MYISWLGLPPSVFYQRQLLVLQTWVKLLKYELLAADADISDGNILCLCLVEYIYTLRFSHKWLHSKIDSLQIYLSLASFITGLYLVIAVHRAV